MHEFLESYPPEILFNRKSNRQSLPLQVNGHIHTPYSFSAFSSVEQAFQLASEEEIKVLGINDFNTFDGYEEFLKYAKEYSVFPLFNVEFMGLLVEEQKNGIRINDPSNPGRTYFSGKGCDIAPSLDQELEKKWHQVQRESNNQTREMLSKTNEILTEIDPDLYLDYDVIMNKFTRGMLRERHIARVVRWKIFEKYPEESQRIKMLNRLFDGKDLVSPLDNEVLLENEIRSKLLKSGGRAYVKENPAAFLPLHEVVELIRNAGGIPCYPVLLDDKNGNYTEFEENFTKLYENLTARNIFCIELIPGRNHEKNLITFVEFFRERGFVITFGTEHNTPALDPLTVGVEGNKTLNNYLKMVNFEGACVVAAHQYQRAQKKKGISYLDKPLSTDEYATMVSLGKNVIDLFLQQEKE